MAVSRKGRTCLNCGETGGHYVPPSFDQIGFYSCRPPIGPDEVMPLGEERKRAIIDAVHGPLTNARERLKRMSEAGMLETRDVITIIYKAASDAAYAAVVAAETGKAVK